MFEKFMDALVMPVVARVGTGVGALLVGSGVANAEAEKIAAGTVALLLLAVDLVVDRRMKARAVRRAVERGQ